MMQKAVIRVTTTCHPNKCGTKSRKAMKVVATVSGVHSIGVKWGEGNCIEIEVTGEGMDVVCLTTLLRRKIGCAELISVSPATAQQPEKKAEGEKQEDRQKDNNHQNNPPPRPAIILSAPPLTYYHPVYDHSSCHEPSCSIL